MLYGKVERGRMKTLIVSKPDDATFIGDYLLYHPPEDTYLIMRGSKKIEGISKSNVLGTAYPRTSAVSILKMAKDCFSSEPLFKFVDRPFKLAKSEIKAISMQEIMNCPVVFVYLYSLPYNVIFDDARDCTFRTFFINPKVFIEAGVYILPDKIWKYLDRNDTIIEAIHDMKNSEDLKVSVYAFKEML